MGLTLIRKSDRTRRKRNPYLDTYKDSACEACGVNDGTVVGAHFTFERFAWAMKPADALTAGLCVRCHDLVDGRTNATLDERRKIWLRVLKNRLPDRYEAFVKEMENA